MMTLREALTVDSQFMLLRSNVAAEYPRVMSALRLVDSKYAEGNPPKGYSLIKREHKKLGFVYYVRYWHDGKMIPSKWCCHTNVYEQARVFAERNKSGLIEKYLQKNGDAPIRFFKRFYDPSSPVYRSERERNGEISEGRRKRYRSVMAGKFIPFLKNRKIKGYAAIDAVLLDEFQDGLLSRGMKPQSVNDDLIAVRKAYKYLSRKGIVRENPCLNLKDVPEKAADKRTHGCYELEKLRGVFNRRWKDKLSFLLNLVIYTTDMRNGEIKSFSKDDIIRLGGCRFISVKRSKTENGVRLVPLHEAVYGKVAEYARGLEGGTPVFGGVTEYRFEKAYKELGRMLKVSGEFLKEKNITYYSGRHFWKTLMNAEGLGEDAEEIFMGHRVSADVAKLYNHRDMRGKERIVKKAREVFRILDKRVFTRGTS